LNWRSPCKYDIVKLLPASSESRNRGIYVCGLDNEILLCDVTGADVKADAPRNHRMGGKRKAGDVAVADLAGEDFLSGPAHACLPDSCKLRISHHR
jgi:hypothetical protein